VLGLPAFSLACLRLTPHSSGYAWHGELTNHTVKAFLFLGALGHAPGGWDLAASLCISGRLAAPRARDLRRCSQGQPELTTGHACARVTPAATAGRGRGGVVAPPHRLGLPSTPDSGDFLPPTSRLAARSQARPGLGLGLGLGQARKRRPSPGPRGRSACRGDWGRARGRHCTCWALGGLV
jgi:hypothetical protein